MDLQYVQVATEESKVAEIAKLQKSLESSIADCTAAKLAAAMEHGKIVSIQSRLDESLKDIAILQKNLIDMEEVKKQNSHLKVMQHYILLICNVISSQNIAWIFQFPVLLIYTF